MSAKPEPTAESRKPRADSTRNRQSLIDAAKAGFAEVGIDISLEEIARRAGVGIGTLYRHFPSRGAVLEAVYRNEVVHPPVQRIARCVLLEQQRYGAGEMLHLVAIHRLQHRPQRRQAGTVGDQKLLAIERNHPGEIGGLAGFQAVRQLYQAALKFPAQYRSHSYFA